MKKETRDILVSTGIIMFAFSWADIWLWMRGGSSLSSVATIIGIATLAVGSGFILHELAHRTFAKKFGLDAEYKAWRFGLGMAVITAVITNGNLVFAAPGAVHISSKPHSRWHKGSPSVDVEEMGVVGLVGPLTNLVLAGIFMLLANITGFNGFNIAAGINAWLGLFNLTPIPPLDGSKVMTWDPKMWVLSTGIAIVALILA